MEDAEVVETLALSLVPGIGSERLRTLVRGFGSAQQALDASYAQLVALGGISRAAATAINEARLDDGRRVLERLQVLGARARHVGSLS